MRSILLITALPWNLIVWIGILSIRVLWGTRLQIRDWGLWVELKADSWPTRTWYRLKIQGEYRRNPESLRESHGEWVTWGGTTFGHGGMLAPGRMSECDPLHPVEVHEHVHVHQYEVASMHGLLMALLICLVGWFSTWSIVVGLLVWMFSGLLKVLTGMLVALIRGGEAYRDSVHEEHAFLVDEKYRVELRNKTE